LNPLSLSILIHFESTFTKHFKSCRRIEKLKSCIFQCRVYWPREDAVAAVLTFASCNGSVKNSFATDWEQNSETSSAVWEIVPDRIKGFSLLGAIGILNIFVRSSSGSGSSPRVDLAWFSSCLF